MRKVYGILVAVCLFVSSCQQPEKVESSGSLGTVSKQSEDVLKVARNFNVFISANMPNANGARVGKSEKTVKKQTTIKSDDGEDLYHIITIKEGGFVIVSADRRTLPIFSILRYQ